MNMTDANRKQASFRLSIETINKLKQLSDRRRKTGQNKSQGAIIDEAIESFGGGLILNKQESKAWTKLQKIGKRSGLSPEVLLEHLLKKHKTISITVD